jgi:hypothetical protein
MKSPGENRLPRMSIPHLTYKDSVGTEANLTWDTIILLLKARVRV